MKESYMERYKKILLEIIEKKLPGCTVYLFGSRARGDNYQGSDIDLGLDFGKKIDFEIISRLKGEIGDTNIPLEVDVVDLNDVGEDFKENVIEKGIKWKS